MNKETEYQTEQARRRDMFAAAALTGIIARSVEYPYPEMRDTHVQVAKDYADKMLEAMK